MFMKTCTCAAFTQRILCTGRTPNTLGWQPLHSWHPLTYMCKFIGWGVNPKIRNKNKNSKNKNSKNKHTCTYIGTHSQEWLEGSWSIHFSKFSGGHDPWPPRGGMLKHTLHVNAKLLKLSLPPQENPLWTPAYIHMYICPHEYSTCACTDTPYMILMVR